MVTRSPPPWRSRSRNTAVLVVVRVSPLMVVRLFDRPQMLVEGGDRLVVSGE